ncbi:chitin deacetylase, partial [Serendipita sp. 396]
KEWLKEIEGVTIPNLKPTKDGSCESDPEFALEAGADGRCWWTCGGCVRETDIDGCQNRERWGLTFDDGPSEYTPKLLTYLQSIDTLATFYLVSSRVISFPQTVQTQVMMGHEISVHTWSHHPLTSLTNEQVVAELGWSRQAIKDVTGVTPLTFRPPFGDFDDRIRAIANAMNLTPVVWSTVGTNLKADTEDFEVPAGLATSTDTVTQFRNTLAVVEGEADAGIITLEHDLFQETVDLAIGFTLPDAISRPGPSERGWSLGTVAQCRGVPAGDAYRETTTNQTVLARLGRTPVVETSSSALGLPTNIPSSFLPESSTDLLLSPTRALQSTALISSEVVSTTAGVVTVINSVSSSILAPEVTQSSVAGGYSDSPPYLNGDQQPYGDSGSSSDDQEAYPTLASSPSTSTQPSTTGNEEVQQNPEFLNQIAPATPVENGGIQQGDVIAAFPSIAASVSSRDGSGVTATPPSETTRAGGSDGGNGLNFGIAGTAYTNTRLDILSLGIILVATSLLMA